MIFKMQRSCNKFRVFRSRVENIQNIHVCFPFKIITQLMFATKFHLVSLYKLYRALLTSLLCVFLMMERPFHLGFCFSSVSSCQSHCAVSFICLDQTRTTGIHSLLILSLCLSSGWGGWLLMEATKVTLALHNDHKQHVVFTANDFLAYHILCAVDAGSEPGVFSLAACIPVSIMPFSRRASYNAFLPGVPLL